MRNLKAKCQRLLKGGYVSFLSYAKINLFLDITGRREDGYHFIRSLFVPVSLFDVLQVRLTSGKGINIECDEKWFDLENNSLKKAYDLFSDEIGLKMGINIRLIKNIPAGSGLGGASSDAATLLNILNILTKLKNGISLDYKKLLQLSARVGADVPFFIKGKPAFVEGIGDKLTEVKLKDDFYIVIIAPDVPFYTEKMYKEFDRLNRLTKVRKGDRHLPPFLGYRYIIDSVFNVFETVIRGSNRRLVMDLKRSLIGYGAEAAALSGSGSAVFGLFKNALDACLAFFRLSRDFINYRVFPVRVLREGRL